MDDITTAQTQLSSLSPAVRDKQERLFQILSEMKSVLVAFSGGVDSSYLAWAAHRVLGSNSLAVTAVCPLISRREVNDSRTMAAFIKIKHEEVGGVNIEDKVFKENPPDRCYFCKKELLEKLQVMATDRGFSHVITGENLDDAVDWRPGRKAAHELGVRHPLAEAQLSKAEIRQLSGAVGLESAGKPTMACLATRVPYGVSITGELLSRIEAGEEYIAGIGFHQFRLRHHGEMCRVEVPSEEFPRLLELNIRKELVNYLKQLGYRYVTLDLEGYRSGAMNEGLDTADGGEE